MSRLREKLAADLAQKVERYGVVVWNDSDGAYRDVAETMVPSDTSFARFDGSWLALRREVEHLLVGTEPPRLVVYVPAEAADPDPLAELRALAADFRIRLRTLVKGALTGELTEQRIDQLAAQCTTLTEVDAALAGGDSTVDARLITLCGDASTVGIAANLLTARHDDELTSRDLWGAAASALGDIAGADLDGLQGDALRASAFRLLVGALVAETVEELPEELSSLSPPSGVSHARDLRAVVDRLRIVAPDAYESLADATESELHLAVLLRWAPGLAALDVVPCLDALGLDAAKTALEAGDHHMAGTLARKRLEQSWWVRGPHDRFASRWRALRSIADLAAALEATPPAGASFEELLLWYADAGHAADAAFRNAELTRLESGLALDDVDDLFHQTRERYEAWLDDLLRATTTAAAADASVAPSRLQRTVHDCHVSSAEGPTAYVLVDALRYELGADLCHRLATSKLTVELEAAVATPPTITPVGMAAVLPGAGDDFDVELGAGDRLVASVDGSPIRTVADRVKRLELAHGKVANLDLDTVAKSANKELKRKIDGAALVLVRSTEIDADGESDHLSTSWSAFDATLKVLHTAISRLLHAGVRRVVITADHGFLAVHRLGDERKIDKPSTGSGEIHRRVWVGKGGTASEATVKVPLAAFGVGGGLDVIAPRGLGVFASGGGLQFFHGGLSPQELVIPVLTITSTDGGHDPDYTIELNVAGGQITTGVVAVTVAMQGTLFERTSGVRLQLSQGGRPVARTVGGDGVDVGTEVVEATVDAPRVITLMITENLAAGSTATLEVMDAATGVRLGDALEVPVAAVVQVEDEL